mmetsp:Transcript_29993/g.77753  ORF Transcript_29993/g.77753 Transcript_29993/m.77753 type:complete len:246 (-) Transcript_29993:70-807(-)
MERWRDQLGIPRGVEQAAGGGPRDVRRQLLPVEGRHRGVRGDARRRKVLVQAHEGDARPHVRRRPAGHVGLCGRRVGGHLRGQGRRRLHGASQVDHVPDASAARRQGPHLPHRAPALVQGEHCRRAARDFARRQAQRSHPLRHGGERDGAQLLHDGQGGALSLKCAGGRAACGGCERACGGAPGGESGGGLRASSDRDASCRSRVDGAAAPAWRLHRRTDAFTPTKAPGPWILVPWRDLAARGPR